MCGRWRVPADCAWVVSCACVWGQVRCPGGALMWLVKRRWAAGVFHRSCRDRSGPRVWAHDGDPCTRGALPGGPQRGGRRGAEHSRLDPGGRDEACDPGLRRRRLDAAPATRLVLAGERRPASGARRRGRRSARLRLRPVLVRGLDAAGRRRDPCQDEQGPGPGRAGAHVQHSSARVRPARGRGSPGEGHSGDGVVPRPAQRCRLPRLRHGSGAGRPGRSARPLPEASALTGSSTAASGPSREPSRWCGCG